MIEPTHFDHSPGSRAPAARGARVRQSGRRIPFDRSLDALPLFRLSDSADATPLSYTGAPDCSWRVLAYPGDRLPGTFDQDVYVEIVRRFHEAGSPADGTVAFTLHSFLRSMGRRADGRTYFQLRSALTRLERTVLESRAAYYDAASAAPANTSFSILSSVAIERKRAADLNQFLLFSSLAASEPGVARVVLAPLIRRNLSAGHTTMLDTSAYFSLQSAVARRVYRLLGTVSARSLGPVWQIGVLDLALMLPLTQRYPSHLLRVLRPAHEMLISAGLLLAVSARSRRNGWVLEYTLEEPAGQ